MTAAPRARGRLFLHRNPVRQDAGLEAKIQIAIGLDTPAAECQEMFAGMTRVELDNLFRHGEYIRDWNQDEHMPAAKRGNRMTRRPTRMARRLRRPSGTVTDRPSPLSIAGVLPGQGISILYCL